MWLHVLYTIIVSILERRYDGVLCLQHVGELSSDASVHWLLAETTPPGIRLLAGCAAWIVQIFARLQPLGVRQGLVDPHHGRVIEQIVEVSCGDRIDGAADHSEDAVGWQGTLR